MSPVRRADGPFPTTFAEGDIGPPCRQGTIPYLRMGYRLVRKKNISNLAAGGNGDGGFVWPRCSNPGPSGHIAKD